jgi:bifunctional N-acetylglucosamine-1-phosphate-uridyltransferase/glucosamine-1-phosphate-acetyltransferase GlmU-like protein
VVRPNPYIHFERDSEGSVSGLKQAREGDSMPEQGESDTGFFCFRTAALRGLLDRMRGSSATGQRTGEFNLLPVIPLAARDGLVLTPHIMSIEETVGINSSADAAAVEQFLLSVAGRPGRGDVRDQV